MPEQKLKGKVAIIGGASKNLGSLISKTLGEEGASVVVHYNSASSNSPAEETVKDAKAAGEMPLPSRAISPRLPRSKGSSKKQKSATAELILLSTLSVKY